MFDCKERIDFLRSFVKKNPDYYNNKEVILSKQGKNNVINPSKKNLERWEYLYKLNKTRDNKLQNRINNKEYEILTKEQKECTFSPKTYSKINNLNKSNFNENYELINNQSFVDRSYAWKKRKDSKINERVKVKEDTQRQECPFIPVSYY